MRPRSMQDVPGLSRIQSPFERFKRFASMILAVPKDEAEKEMENAATKKPANGTRRKRNGDRKI